MKRILLVEDEESLMDVIRLNLEMEGYLVTSAVDGEEGLRKLQTERLDLAILDVMLPKIDGFTVCEKARKAGITVPVLFLTAKNAGTDRVKGLKIGGDDYLAKPFNLEELLLRVEKLVQRSQSTVDAAKSLGEYRFGPNRVNFRTYEIEGINVGKKTLTNKECMTLKLLVERKNEVVSRTDILHEVWGHDDFPTGRTIDNFVLNFRKYFEANPKEPSHFQSVRGVGYKFVP